MRQQHQQDKAESIAAALHTLTESNAAKNMSADHSAQVGQYRAELEVVTATKQDMFAELQRAHCDARDTDRATHVKEVEQLQRQSAKDINRIQSELSECKDNCVAQNQHMQQHI